MLIPEHLVHENNRYFIFQTILAILKNHDTKTNTIFLSYQLIPNTLSFFPTVIIHLGVILVSFSGHYNPLYSFDVIIPLDLHASLR